jgi:hypothetical protein
VSRSLNQCGIADTVIVQLALYCSACSMQHCPAEGCCNVRT